MTTKLTLRPAARARPKQLLRKGNSNLGRDKNVWVFTLPALYAVLPDGTTVVTCPQAGTCALVCYARFGTYTWSNVAPAHVANLLFVVEDLPGWEAAMRKELAAEKFKGAYVRIHDAGDFYQDAYLLAWLRIIRDFPETTFYAYTKEILRIRGCIDDPGLPANFITIFSFGGDQDALIDEDNDRIGDVFPTEEAVAEAGYASQLRSDLDAISGSRKVGMAAKQRPQALRRQGARTFREWQREQDRRRAQLAGRRG
ncbi:hypothetical protein KDK95_33215 [Actinospica sp. MGRD01-02]|uniref:Gene product 88 domain-containing protein n=1 Tax=Actinospica acidithermotolerans TaxID=2828514 RepID=A0A941EP72_9ACTN|nr:hypothetical protein [Actinospica acidithermotolerans]MBR7831214.1 hypothetical protein [Actinospica acidithermotolerans]